MKINPNFRDPTTLEAILKTAFGAYDPNCADLTSKPLISGATFGLDGDHQLTLCFVIRRKPYIFYYDYLEELASGYIEKPDEECGSDDDPDWEMCTPQVGWALLTFIAAIKEGKV